MTARRFFASLTILSVTLTQACPAWAADELRVRLSETLRTRSPSKGTGVNTGLEEALTGGAGAGGGVPAPAKETFDAIRRLLRLRQPKSLQQRIQALEDYAQQLSVGTEVVERVGDPHVPLERRIAALDDLLGLALENSILEQFEIDPELAVALLARSDSKILARARSAFSALERICPTCGDHLYHEQGKGHADLEFDQHDRLHVRTSIAAAVEFLSSATGRLPTVRQVLDGHHSEEPARSLGVMAQMVSAFARNDGGPEVPSVAAVRLGNDLAFLERLSAVTAQTGPVILHVRHPRTQGDGADHWVSVRYVDRENETVDLYVNGEEKKLWWDEFRRDYLPSGDVHGLLSTRQDSLWVQTQGGRIFPATQEELSSVIGCCGIIITMGRRSGEGQFASMQDLAYRGQDNAGVTVHDLDGLYTIKVEGSPTQLIRELEVEGQGHPEEGMAWYLETFPQAPLESRVRTGLEKLRSGQPLNRQERRSIHRLWLSLTLEERAAIAQISRVKGRELLNAHQYYYVNPVPPGMKGAPMRRDGLYSQRFYAEGDGAVRSPGPGMLRKQVGEVDQWNSVGRGNQGEVWSGRPFHVPPAGSSAYFAHVKALQDLQEEVNRFYDYELSYIRDRLRFLLLERLEATVAHETLTSEEAAKLMREFLRLFETVAMGRDLVESDVDLWRGIWGMMANADVWFAGHVPWDPVRHVFRLQKGLVGILRQRPKWREAVEREFADLLREGRIFEQRDWFQDWLVENFSGTASKAFEALTAWFQREFIPTHVRQRMGIELGRVDAITLQYLEIVDEVFGHDRWATTGSKEAKDAQPHMDTGLLSGLSRDEKKGLVQEATLNTERTQRLQVSPTATSHEREQVRKLLSENFRAVALRFLEVRPEKVGSPQRSTPHNGDLDSGVQQGVRLRVAERGYLPVRRMVDESWQIRTETILTDTWGLLGLHEDIYDSFELDAFLGLTDGWKYREGKRDVVGFMPDAYRKRWNEIAENLLEAEKHRLRAIPITGDFDLAEEVAHRLTNLEFARGILIKPGKAGSEIGAGLMTTMEPRLKAFVSHNRPIYLMAVKDKDGKLDWQVSSDYRTALRLFDRKEVAQGVQDSNELFLRKERELKELDERTALDAAQKAQAEAGIFRGAEEDQREINGRFKLEFMFTFKGEEKYIHTGREFNPDTGQWDLLLEVSNFEGRTIARYRSGQVLQAPPEKESKNIKVERGKSVEVDIASRFGFSSYGEKEIHQIPLALRETRFWYGLKPDGALDMSREGVGALYGAAADYGLNRQKLLDWYRGGGDTIILTGVGSSENDALADVELLRFLLPGVRVKVKDPSTLLNTAADFDPKTTMVVALSWSGTTALTLSILESLRERGLLCCAITGNPDKEIGVAVRDSGGVVKAHTRQEVAVYTTVGFSTILYDLMLMAAYFNLLREELETDEDRKADLKRRRSEVAQSLYVVPEIIRGLRDRPERSLASPESYIHQVGGRLAPYSGIGLAGDDPALAEIRLKLAEVRNVVGAVFRYSSDQPWHLIRAGMPQNRRKGWFVDATTVSKFRRALGWIQEALSRGQPVVVQTFDQDVAFSTEEEKRGYLETWEELNDELNKRAEEAGKDGRPHLDFFRVPRVHPLVQPIVNVQIGAPLATTMAKLAGLGSEARDAPRNLAKSVTVQAQGKQARAMRIRDFVQAYRAAAAGLEERNVMVQYAEQLQGRWESLDPTLRAIHRLPMRMQEILAGFSAPRGFSWGDTVMGQRFGDRLERLRRVVILSSEDENAEIAALMAQELLEYRESVTTNSEKEKIFQKVRDERGQYEENAVQRLINGDMYEIRFVRSPEDRPPENRVVITRVKEEDGEWKPDVRELVLRGDERGIVEVDPASSHLRRREGEALQYQVNGQWYTVSADVGRGVNLTAVEPELAGVEVEVVAVEEEEDLRKATIHPEDTLVVALSRSRQQKGEFEREVAPIASVGGGRDAGQKQALRTSPEVKSEEHFSGILEGLKQRTPELAIFCCANGDSLIHRHANAGSAQLPEDLDAIDATPAFYLALLRFGIKLGTVKGISQAAAYQEGLDLIPVLAAGTLPLAYQERVVVGTELFSRATRGIRIALNHRPIEVRYEPESEMVTFHDEGGQVGGFGLVVDPDLDIVRSFKNPVNRLVLDGREYDIHFHPDHGLFIESRLPDYLGGGSLSDSLISLVQRESGNPYTNWIIVGGGADFASASLYRKQMTTLAGSLNNALVVDASVHGDLAEVDDRVAKWRDRARRRGIDPKYDPDSPTDLTQKDAASLQLGTDRRAYSASTIDLQRFVTRSGIVFPVVQVPDLNRSEIVESRAFAAPLAVPEAPNLLTVIPHMVLAPLFAYQLGRSQSEQYRYRPESTWAEVAQLPRVIPAEEGKILPIPPWEKALRKKVGPDHPKLVQWFVEAYNSHRSSPDLPVIETRVSADHPDSTSFVAVIPYEHIEGREPIAGINSRIEQHFQERDRRLNYDTRYYWTGFREGKEAPVVGLLHISFRTPDVLELGLQDAVRNALQPYVRGARSAAPQGGPRGPVHGIVWNANAAEVVQDDWIRWRAERVLGSIARSLAGTVRGAVSMPPGVNSLDGMGSPQDPASARANLDRVAEHVRTAYARSLLERASHLLDLSLAPRRRQDRLGLMDLGNNSVGWIIAGESVKALLTNNYGVPLQLGETGSGVALVALDSSAVRWVLPPELDLLYNEPYVIQWVTHIPREAWERMDEAQRQRVLNPLPSVALDADGTTELERQIDALAQYNGIPSDPGDSAGGRRDLSRVRVGHLPRDRSRLLAQELERLARERGLQLDFQPDGSITSGMASVLPPRNLQAGYTQEDPLEISWTTTWATQGLQLLTAIGGRALPEGAVGAVRFLSRSIHDPASLEMATSANPIGGATDWSEPARLAFSQWQGNLGASLAEGRPLYHTDITGEAMFLFIPTTGLGVDLHNPIPEVRGVPALDFQEERNQVHYYAIVAQRGNLYVEEIQASIRLDIPVPPLLLPLDLQIPPVVAAPPTEPVPAVKAAAALPEILQPHRKVVEQLIREYEKARRVEFRLLRGSAGGETVVAISGSLQERGTLTILTDVMDRSGIGISDTGIYHPDDVGVAYVVVPVPREEIQRTRGPGERLAGTSVEERITERIAERFLTPERLAFRGWLLQQNRDEPEIEWLETLYSGYQSRPKFTVEVVPGGGGDETAVVGLTPYGATAPVISESEFTKAVEAELQRLADEEKKASLVQGPTIAFVRRFNGPPHPMLVVQLTFQMPRAQLLDSDISEAVDNVLTQLGNPPAVPKTGLEEPPVLVREGAAYRVEKAGVIRGDAEVPLLRLPNGALVVAEAGDSRIRLSEGVYLEPNAVLVAPQGQSIKIGAGTRILTGAQIWGDVAIGDKGQIAGTLTGKTVIGDGVVVERGANPTVNNSVIGDGTKFTKGSATVVDDAMLLPRRIRTRGPDGSVVEKMQPVLIKQTGAIERSVLWGTPAFQFSVILDSVMDFALAGNHVMISRSALKGVSPSSRTAAAHYNYLISLFSVPLAERRDLTQADQRELLRRELAALRFGVLEERRAETVIPDDKRASRPVENLKLRLGNETVEARAKSSNLGAVAGTSNFDPRFEVKAPTLLWGGWAGVDAVFAAPTEVGPLSGVASQAQVKGIDALEPGTLVLPGGKGGVKEDYLIETAGRLGKGVETNIDIRLQVIRLLEIEAQVALNGLAYETSSVAREGLVREARLYQSYLKEAREDLERYLEIVSISVANLTVDLAGKPADDKLQEQQRVLARREAYLQVVGESAENVAQALEKIRTMANINTFRLPQQGIVRIERGSKAFSQDRIAEGLRRVRGEDGRRKPLAILFAAGAFSRFVDSVNAESPYYAEAARRRGLANSEGNASKLTAPMGVSGLGPILRILEGWAELGRRANTPVDVVIVDSAGNREMLLRVIVADRSSPHPRVPWRYLNILPGGIPVDQGEGVQVLSRGAAGQLQPLSEYNPATGQMDRPVMRPSGEFGAFHAGVQTARAAGVSIPDRDIVPIYADQSMLYSDPDFLAAALAQAGEADITGLNTDHREVGGQWVPSGGVWAEAQWPDGATALVIAERNVRDPSAAGVFNPRLDSDERAVIAGSPNGTGFPYNAGAPIFNGRFVEAELTPERISARLSTKKISITTGPGTTAEIEVAIPEMELTEAVQKGTQRPAGRPAPWKAQMIVTGNRRYQGVKTNSNLQPGNEQIYREARAVLQGRLTGQPIYVEVAPGAGQVLGIGEIQMTDSSQVGIVQDRRGLWIHRRIIPPTGVTAADLFTEGRLLVPADQDGNITLSADVQVSPQVYDSLPEPAAAEEQTGLEELTLPQIYERLRPVLSRLVQQPVKTVVLDVDGVATAQDGDLSPETAAVLDGLVRDVPDSGMVLLTDLSPGQLRDRVESRLSAAVTERTRSFPLSGAEFVGHRIPDNAVAVLEKWVAQMGGKEAVLRMEDKRKEFSDGQISEESLDHGFDINRGAAGRIVGIDVELNKDWLKAQTAGNGNVDPRSSWVEILRTELLGLNVPDPVAQTLRPAGSGSMTWVPVKGQALIHLAGAGGWLAAAGTVFVDDSANHFLEFPEVAQWPGLLVYIGAHNSHLPANVIQIARPGEGKPANGPEIARQIVQMVRAAGRLSPQILQTALQHQTLHPDVPLAPRPGQDYADLLDNYAAVQQVLQQNLGLTFSQAVELIQAQARTHGTAFSQEVSGVLDVPDSELPDPAEFDRILSSIETLFLSGGNSGRAQLQLAREANVRPGSQVPVQDDGGGYGKLRYYVNQVTLTGDVANQSTNNATPFVRVAMGDRIAKSRTDADTLRSLLLQEVATAIGTFKKQVQSKDPNAAWDDVVQRIAGEPSLIRALASLISAHRIISDRYPDFTKTDVPAAGSGQNMLGLGISIRAGLLDAVTPEKQSVALKKSVLLWKRALGLKDSDGLVVPSSLEFARLYFVYEDEVPSVSIPDLEDKDGLKRKVGDSKIAPRDFFTVTLQDGELILADGVDRNLAYDATEQAYVAREPGGAVVNRFERFPGEIENAVRNRLTQVDRLTLIRGEDHASEEDTLYDNTKILAWGAEYPAGKPPQASLAAQQMDNAILNGTSPVKTVVIGPGSEGTSIAPHLWQRETVEFLRKLRQQRPGVRVVFEFNPSQTSDSYDLDPLGQMSNYERIIREVSGDPSVRFEELVSEVVLFDHADPWVTAYNPAVFAEIKRIREQEKGTVSPDEVDYLRILGPTAEERTRGILHGQVKKNRQPLPVTPETLATLHSRFGKDKVWYVPLGDVRATMESSRGKISVAARVLAITHRLGLILYPAQRATLLPEAVREETRIYREKHEGQAPTAEQLADFLNKFGAGTTSAEVETLMGGLEESTPAEVIYWRESDTDREAGIETAVSDAAVFEVPVGETAGRVVILTPKTALVGLGALSALHPSADDPRVQVALIVENAAQELAVTGGLEEAGVTLAMPVVDLEKTGWTVAEAIVDLQVRAWSQALETYVVETLEQLKGIAPFLEFIPAAVRSWNAWVERITTGVAA